MIGSELSIGYSVVGHGSRRFRVQIPIAHQKKIKLFSQKVVGFRIKPYL